MKPKQLITAEDLSDLKFYEYVSLNKQGKDYDVIIIGGSYAGLSAALTLGRALRKVLIIDKGDALQANDVYSHNFITHDGEIASSINAKAKDHVLKYKNVRFLKDKAETVVKEDNRFIVETRRKEKFTGKKILFATGLIDMMPAIPGFKECWGISILHCPYCNGYEYSDADIGILANGDIAFELVKLLFHWSRHLGLFTNGDAGLSQIQINKINEKKVKVISEEIESFDHKKGQLKNIVLKNGDVHSVNAIFCKPGFLQATDIPRKQLGCELTAEGFIKTDIYQRTSVPGVYSAGDNTIVSRAISLSAASGTVAAMHINKELIEETF